MRTSLFVLTAALLLSACTPALVATPPTSVAYAVRGASVRVLPIRDLRPEKLHVSSGYVGLFAMRQEDKTGEETSPARVISQALSSELRTRGQDVPGGEVTVGCTMPAFLIRYRNYAGAYSATDSWGYLDLTCKVTSGGRVIWSGPIHARHHRVNYVLMSSFTDAIWPAMTGALVQQAAAILNREAFHLRASPALIEDARAQLASTDPDERYLAAYTLGVTGDPQVIPLLVAELQSADKKLRRAIVDALGTLGARSAMPLLLSRFDGEDGNVQWATIKAILQTGDPQAFAWLRGKARTIKADTLVEIVDDVLAHEGE